MFFGNGGKRMRAHWMMATAAVALMATAVPALAQEAASVTPAAQTASTGHTVEGGLPLKTLASMDRVSSPVLSPDGKRVVYAVSSVDYDANKSSTSLWVANVDGSGDARKLPISEGGASNPEWAPDGRSIYFTSSRGGSNQVWRTDAEGNAAAQVTMLPVSVSGFRIAPDGRSLVLGISVFVDCDTLECTKTRGDTAAKDTQTVYDELPLRVFDRWYDNKKSHLWVQPLNASGLAEGSARSLTQGIGADFGVGGIEFTRDGAILVSTKLLGDRNAFTNNNDLYRIPLAGGAPQNLTAGHTGPDSNPVLSPDGRRLAWLASPRENVGGDQAVVMLGNADGSDARALSRWDRGPGDLTWRSDGRALYATAADQGQQRLFEIDTRSGDVRALTDICTVSAYDEQGGTVVYALESFTSPTQLYVLKGGEARQLTNLNAEALASIRPSRPDEIRFAGWNGEEVHGWVFKPANYVEGQKYPAVYLIHGGPKSPWTESWSYRWNPQVYTGAGYAVVMINFHGSPGYGQAFTDAINSNWGTRPLEDLRKGWEAAVANNSFIDANRSCALGASYGGYMINMIAGQWNEPWQCLVNHAGVFDVPQLMNAMDSGTFIHEFEGTTWDRKAVYDAQNPETYAGQWKKPMLVLHGSKDFRVPMEQGLATFSALQRQGIPSRFVHVPNANHWVLEPKAWVNWQQEILDWTARYTAPAQ